MTVQQRIEAAGLIPVVVMDDADRAPETAAALAEGGVPVMEITLRTAAGLDAIEKAAVSAPGVLVGGGTVLTLEQCRKAVDRGAAFIVSPGYDPEIVRYCLDRKTAVFPGCVTPTEIMAALGVGIGTVKFFPANIYGGVGAMKALAGPFPNVRFIPTGGIDGNNLAEFIIPQVAAVGGGWLCDRKAVNAGDYRVISETCARAAEIVKGERASRGLFR